MYIVHVLLASNDSDSGCSLGLYDLDNMLYINYMKQILILKSSWNWPKIETFSKNRHRKYVCLLYYIIIAPLFV